jgi:hypothetical protein
METTLPPTEPISKEFILHRDRELGKKYGVEYAEAFHNIGTQPSRLDEYLRQNIVPVR